jgi:hypothetical protein
LVQKSVPPVLWLRDDGIPPRTSLPTGALGHDLGTWIVEQEGGVWSLDPEGEIPTRFVCASMELLQIMLDVFAERGQVITKMTDEQAEQFDRAMGSRLADIDPTAFAHPDNWWPLVVEQCIQGLL